LDTVHVNCDVFNMNLKTHTACTKKLSYAKIRISAVAIATVLALRFSGLDSCCNESLYLQYNTLPPVQLFNYQVLNLVHKVV